MADRSKVHALILFVAAAFGAAFSALSTLDFIQHLDRQVHSLHCSFIPGVTSEGMAEAGCRAVMNSRYSSFFRDSYWGGIPISLLALAVFAYLAFVTADMYLSGRLSRRSDAGYLVLSAALPLLTSAVFFFIAMTEVKALCKLCVGVYVSSIAFFVTSIVNWRSSEAPEMDPSAQKRAVIYFIEGVLFVAMAVGLYVGLVPEYKNKVTACGSLSKPEDKQKVLVTLPASKAATETSLEVVDPLCPACKQFTSRVEGDGLLANSQRSILLFPLDSECNWMLSEALHPGACMVSRALLCAEKDFAAMWDFVMDNQESFRITATKAPDEVKAQLVAKFPKVSGCMEQADTKIRLNNMLRYAVQNRMPLTTPQLYLGGKRLCEEDSDLGLNYSVAVLNHSTTTAPAGKAVTK